MEMRQWVLKPAAHTQHLLWVGRKHSCASGPETPNIRLRASLQGCQPPSRSCRKPPICGGSRAASVDRTCKPPELPGRHQHGGAGQRLPGFGGSWNPLGPGARSQARWGRLLFHHPFCAYSFKKGRKRKKDKRSPSTDFTPVGSSEL